MKAQELWKENNAGGFFVPKTVLRGGNCLYLVDGYTQLNKNLHKPYAEEGRVFYARFSLA